MNKLIITDGPSPSGKTTFAYAWVDAKPDRRARAGTIAVATRLLGEGFDVVLDAERNERATAIKHFSGRPNTEVRLFTIGVPA